uniref:NR LBD domain-containing protein n=1 Tax=Rhabditophanes sp. KR3021 TaxID=114890 RepID=A0AC35UG29_9BILA
MIAPPYDEILGKQSECSDLESSSDRAVIKEASLSTSDYQKIVKLIVDQVKATFASKFTSPEMFSEVPLNHLQRANMAIDLYIQRREIRPVGEILINAKVEFMEQMQFRKKAFIQNTDILMFFSDFAKLECGEKMFLFRHFWPQFSTFANAIVSMQVFARYPDKFYYIVSENKAIDTCSDVCTNLSYLQGYAPEAIELLKKPLAFLIDKIFNPIKQLNLDRTECAYITLQILWSQKKKPGLSAATEEMMDRLLREINTEMHHYYVYEKKISDYVFRMSEMMKLIMVCFKHCQNLRETVMAAKTFNLFESLYNESEVSSLVGVV